MFKEVLIEDGAAVWGADVKVMRALCAENDEYR
jgi:hypothetical protein